MKHNYRLAACVLSVSIQNFTSCSIYINIFTTLPQRSDLSWLNCYRSNKSCSQRFFFLNCAGYDASTSRASDSGVVCSVYFLSGMSTVRVHTCTCTHTPTHTRCTASRKLPDRWCSPTHVAQSPSQFSFSYTTRCRFVCVAITGLQHAHIIFSMFLQQCWAFLDNRFHSYIINCLHFY